MPQCWRICSCICWQDLRIVGRKTRRQVEQAVGKIKHKNSEKRHAGTTRSKQALQELVG